MEEFISQIEWTPVLFSTVITIMLGYLWYSPVLFLHAWLKGLPEPPKWQAPLWMPLSTQIGSLFFLAVIINQLQNDQQWLLLVLVVFTVMGFSKTNGMYSGKTKKSISIEVLYILASALIMIVVNAVI